jgi:hypothetical protein
MGQKDDPEGTAVQKEQVRFLDLWLRSRVIPACLWFGKLNPTVLEGLGEDLVAGFKKLCGIRDWGLCLSVLLVLAKIFQWLCRCVRSCAVVFNSSCSV